MRNVQCAGNPEMQYVRVIGNKATFANGGPCGWKGERLGWISQPQRPDETLEAMVERVATNKPCPRCGGKVELIPEVEGGGS